MASLIDRVVVITGGSSGIGRATARALARRGAIVVVAARRGDALAQVVRECIVLGAGAALAVITDVTIEADVDHLARTVLERWGRIDVWINNAGVTLFARLEEATLALHERVIVTNLFGAMAGARAAIPVFRRQHAGILVNMGSVLSELGHGYVPSYAISKFAPHGMSESLRVSVADEPAIQSLHGVPVHRRHAALRERDERDAPPRALSPMQSPEDVARAVVGVIERPRASRYVTRWIMLGRATHALAPRTAERLLLAALRTWHLEKHREPDTDGNLFAPTEVAADVHGTRPPRIGVVAFAGWLAARFAWLPFERIGQAARPAAVPRVDVPARG